MSKNTILQKLRNPQLTDLSENRLRRISKERGISLRGKMTQKGIINRIRNPTRYYTIEGLKQIAENNNITVDRNITKPNLIRILQNANLITVAQDVTPTPINIGVRQTTTEPLELIRTTKPKTPVKPHKNLENYKNYIKSLNNDLMTARRLKTIQKKLEEKEKKFEEDQKRRFTPHETRSAFQKFALQYTIGGNEDDFDDYSDAYELLYDARYSIIKIFNQHKQTKVKLIFKCNMIKDSIEGEIIQLFAFHSNIEIHLEGTDEDELYDTMVDTIEEKIQKLENIPGTRKHLHSVIGLELHTVALVPLNGSSYIELPKYLKDKKTIINIKNDDNKCVLRALNPVENHNERVDKTLKSNLETLNTTGIVYPVSLLDINKFECLNSNISINVFGCNEIDRVYPIKRSKNINILHKINLLLIENEGVTHYCLIKDLSKLTSLQVSKHNGKIFICDNCLNHFQKEDSLKNHKEYCDTNECVKINMPQSLKNFLIQKRFHS